MKDMNEDKLKKEYASAKKSKIIPSRDLKDIAKSTGFAWIDGVELHPEVIRAKNEGHRDNHIKRILLSLIAILGITAICLAVVQISSVQLWKEISSGKNTEESILLLSEITKNNDSIFKILATTLTALLSGLFVAIGHYIRGRSKY